jgi:hypothetical protein
VIATATAAAATTTTTTAGWLQSDAASLSSSVSCASSSAPQNERANQNKTAKQQNGGRNYKNTQHTTHTHTHERLARFCMKSAKENNNIWLFIMHRQYYY